ncbi:MAG: hypothetical protein GY868_04945 [Deltaproteobacteria bacterium]|nr:hypothetical protein [Deltaproteobacteria bacterium]
MISNEEVLNQVVDKVTEQVVGDIKETISRTIEKEITKSLSRTMIEGEFYKRINTEMQSGLRMIYKEISTVEQESGGREVGRGKHETEELFTETSDQLDQIVRATEKATVDIMEVVEKHLDLQEQSQQQLEMLQKGELGPEGIAKLLEVSSLLSQDLMKVMTTLSFQDITGQRIKRIIGALKKVEETVFELYLSTGLKIKAREEAPEKDFDELEKETKEKVSELKGPQTGANQNDIDDLFAQLSIGG